MRGLVSMLVLLLLAAGCARGAHDDRAGSLPRVPPATVASTVPDAPAATSVATATSTTAPPPAAPQPATPNLGLAAEWITPLDDGAAIGVGEAAQGVDLNGDGDWDDVLISVVVGGQVLATDLVASWGVDPLDGGGFTVQLSESDAGRDLNGDGDTLDGVPQLWTESEGVVNLGMAGWVGGGVGHWLWLGVYEAWEGEDLSGNGSVGTENVAVRRDSDGLVLNTGWAAGQIVPLADGSALFGVFESEEGDLNGDGDADDHVAVWWRGPGDAEVIAPDAYVIRSTTDGGAYVTFGETDVDLNDDGVVARWTLRFWHPDRDVVDLPVATVCHEPTPDGGAIFRVAEFPDYWAGGRAGGHDCMAGTDLNGDGDCDDFVLHRWSPSAGLVDLGLAQQGWCPECTCGYMQAGDRVLVAVWDVVDPKHGEDEPPYPELAVIDGSDVRRLGVTVGWSTAWAPVDDGVVLTIPERGSDLNGDGDGDDAVFHVVEFDGGATNLGLAGWIARPISAGRALLLVDEQAQGTDLNGDGRVAADTIVLHLWRPGAGVTNLAVTAGLYTDEVEGTRPFPVAEADGGGLVVLVPERESGGGDLNGDGDVEDVVVHVVTLPRG